MEGLFNVYPNHSLHFFRCLGWSHVLAALPGSPERRRGLMVHRPAKNAVCKGQNHRMWMNVDGLNRFEPQPFDSWQASTSPCSTGCCPWEWRCPTFGCHNVIAESRGPALPSLPSLPCWDLGTAGAVSVRAVPNAPADCVGLPELMVAHGGSRLAIC